MIKDGLFEKFPCDAVFAIHNKPGVPLGHIVTKAGPAAGRRRPLGHPHHRQGRPCRASASHHRSDGGRRQHRDGAADHRQPQHRSASTPTVVTVGFFKAGSAYNVIPGDVHIGGTTRTTTPENRALVEAPHRGDLPRRRADARRQDRGRAPAGLSADGEQCRATRASPSTSRPSVCGEHAVSRQRPAQHGRGGFLLHAGTRAGRHGDGWATAAGRGGQPAQLALRLQRHGDPVRRQLLRAHRRTLPRRAKAMAVIRSAAKDLIRGKRR